MSGRNQTGAGLVPASTLQPLAGEPGIQVAVRCALLNSPAFASLNVDYVGDLGLLVDKGCISARMAGVVVSGKRHIKTDENGDTWHFNRTPVASCPKRVKVTRHISMANESLALTLPGMGALLVQAKREWAERARIPPGAQAGSQVRSRAVGRWRRLVTWAASGNVITPDWRSVRQAAWRAQEGAS